MSREIYHNCVFVPKHISGVDMTISYTRPSREYNPDEMIHIGVAYCNKRDMLSRRTGNTIASGRAAAQAATYNDIGRGRYHFSLRYKDIKEDGHDRIDWVALYDEVQKIAPRSMKAEFEIYD